MRYFNARSRPRRFKTLILGLGDELPFGYHKNRTVAWIIDHNPSYIRWLGNSGAVTLTPPALERLRHAIEAPGYREIMPHEACPRKELGRD